jgi:DNA-binding MarR family transcriptional regulator
MNVMPFLDVDGTRTTTLSQRLGTSKQAVTKLIDELEARGYVTRVPDPADGRAKVVSFTAKGRRLLDAGESAKLAIEAMCLRDFGKPEREKLMTALKQMVSDLEGI